MNDTLRTFLDIQRLPISVGDRWRLFQSFFILKQRSRIGGQDWSRMRRFRWLDYELFTYNYGMSLYLLREIFIHQIYFFATNSEHPVIFDGGANIGLATLYFKWQYPDAEVHAFEPDPVAFDLLKRNVEHNHLQNVHCYNFALYDYDGEISFYTDAAQPGHPVMSTIEEHLPKQRISVPCQRLNPLLRDLGPIDFLKLDVEGAESAILRELQREGLLSLIRQGNIEYHHNIDDALPNLGWFLNQLEANDFEYQLQASYAPVSGRRRFQDVYIYFMAGVKARKSKAGRAEAAALIP